MADREIVEQIKKLDQTRADRFEDLTTSQLVETGLMRVALADAVELLVKDYREVAELYLKGKIKGATSMAKERRDVANHLLLLATQLRTAPAAANDSAYRRATDANGPSTPMKRCDRAVAGELHGPHDWTSPTGTLWCPGHSERDVEGVKALVAERAGAAGGEGCEGLAAPPDGQRVISVAEAVQQQAHQPQGDDVQQAQPQSAPPAGAPAWVDAPALPDVPFEPAAPQGEQAAAELQHGGIVDAPTRPGVPVRKGRRLTWRDLRALADGTHPAGAGLPAHLSHSQMSTLTDCPTKYVMQRSETLGVLERPEWATTGGSAFHAAAEWFERLVLEVKTPQYVRDRLKLAGGVAVVWSNALHAEIAEVSAAHPDFAVDEWRASKRGAEGYTWWLINGQTMLQQYIDARFAELQQPWRSMLYTEQPTAPDPQTGIAGSELQPAIELEYVLEVEGTPVKGKIDQVWVITGSSDTGMRRGDALVEDLKAGAGEPDESQLREYAVYLSRKVMPNVRIWGRFYDARRAAWSEPALLIDPEPDAPRNAEAWEELAFKVEDATRRKLSGSFAPRKSNYCNGCSVKHACPIFATLAA